MVAGPDGLLLRTPVDLRGEDFSTVAEFTVAQGERVPFELIWHPSHQLPPGPSRWTTPSRTERWWSSWSDRSPTEGRWSEPVRDSLVVLKGLTYAPTGGIVAAATTSLPEAIGGPGTGTTATAGSGTPPSRSWRSWPAATPTRPRPGGTGCCEPWPDDPTRPRSCTAPVVSTG